MIVHHAESKVRSVAKFQGSSGDILVSTFYGENVYQTAVKHPDYDETDLVLAQEYESEDKAREGHNFWVQAVLTNSLPPLIGTRKISVNSGEKTEETEQDLPDEIKITFVSLIKILKKYESFTDRIQVLRPSNNDHIFVVTICEGSNKGVLIYDLKSMVAKKFSPKWRHILCEAKAAAEDNMFPPHVHTNEQEEDILL